jgi:thioredoxin reductase (NADPH)
MTDETRELIIIGGGPAGYTAALYAARANLNPLVIEGFAWGGQLMITSDVENYPGYPDGILGPQMMQDFRRQAERFGAEFVTDDVTKVDFSEHPLRVAVGDTEHAAEAVIIATGASARQLGLESERALQGKGVSYCAVCDAAFFRDREVVVVGGGDSTRCSPRTGRRAPSVSATWAATRRARSRRRACSSRSDTTPTRTSSSTSSTTIRRATC